MAKDLYHFIVKEILIADGWTITDDPYYIKWSPEWEIDLGAEKMIGAEKESHKIAVEIKSFLKASFANEFHTVLGQYLNYLSALRRTDEERTLFLAVPNHVWVSKFQIEGIKASIEDYQIKIVLYDVETKKIERWIT